MKNTQKRTTFEESKYNNLHIYPLPINFPSKDSHFQTTSMIFITKKNKDATFEKDSNNSSELLDYKDKVKKFKCNNEEIQTKERTFKIIIAKTTSPIFPKRISLKQ